MTNSTDPSRRRPGCFRVGCCSCLVLVGLVAAVMALLVGVQAVYERGDRSTTTKTVSRPLPSLDQWQGLLDRGEVGAEGEALEISSRPPRSLGDLLQAPLMPKPVRVELDLDVGEFRIEVGAPGSGVAIDGEVEERAFVFSESSLMKGDQHVVRISSRPRGGLLGMTFRGAGNNPSNTIIVRLPPDVPIDLVGKVGLGESTMELGGLLLRKVDLELGVGEHTLSFSRPMAIPMEELILDKGMGELTIVGLGNASPGRVDVRQSIGGLSVDLGGDWVMDSRIELSNRMGELIIEPTRIARIRIESGGPTLGERSLRVPDVELPDDAVTLTLRVRAAIGEVRMEER